MASIRPLLDLITASLRLREDVWFMMSASWSNNKCHGMLSTSTPLSFPFRTLHPPHPLLPMTDQLELDPNHTTEPEPSHPARRSYWVLRLVRSTILHGGYLTPKLFAPKDIWTQVLTYLSFFLFLSCPYICL